MAQNLTSQQIHAGALAKADFRAGKNPPSWVTDEGAWAKAKEAASKSYDMDEDAFWPVVASIYEKMSNAGLPMEAEAVTQDQLKNDAMTFLGNAEVADDGWALIPYGDWPHEMGMQKFHRQQAERIVQAFQNSAGRFFKRATVGLPIVKGHPDHPVAAIANQYPDKEEKGQIADMQVRDSGLALKLILSNAGAELVRKGWKFISPLWLGELVSSVGAAMKTYAPNRILSVGLVSHPNIPVPSLANSAPVAATNKSKTMNPNTLKLLGLSDKATPEEIEAKVTALANSATALANEQTARTSAEGKATALENEKKELTTKLATTETALANERAARADEAIAAALKAGRITAADKPVWEKRLKADAEEFKALANAKPGVKTTSRVDEALRQSQDALENAVAKGKQGETDADGDDDGDECGLSNEEIAAMSDEKRGKHIRAAIAKHMGNASHSPALYNAAYAAAKKANPHLFGTKATVTHE